MKEVLKVLIVAWSFLLVGYRAMEVIGLTQNPTYSYVFILVPLLSAIVLLLYLKRKQIFNQSTK